MHGQYDHQDSYVGEPWNAVRRAREDSLTHVSVTTSTCALYWIITQAAIPPRRLAQLTLSCRVP